MSTWAIAFLLNGLVTGLVYKIFPHWFTETEIPEIHENNWWGRGDPPEGAEMEPIVSRPYVIEVKEDEIKYLKTRLKSARYSEPLENCKFHYGFPADQLKKVVAYWLNEYNWTVHEKHLNQYKHYKANIEGIDVHYMRISPKDNKNIKVIPLMLIHGWPGSIVEYLKVIPLLASHDKDWAYDIICPSIPGFGYSEGPHKMGFNLVYAAKILNKLMLSLKFDKYYVQGTDGGSEIASAMAIFFSNNLQGLHVNLVMYCPTGPRFVSNLILGFFNPKWVVDEGHEKTMFPFSKYFSNALLETAYAHIQGTKPDTVGSGLTDSPVGLAAYILEKFAIFTNNEHRDLSDGGLTKKFSLDELLTNVMVYWTTNSITSSFRSYKENSNAFFMKFLRFPIKIPVGISRFANELFPLTKAMIRDRYKKIVLYRHHSKGGHFPAMEEPEIIAKDVNDFVRENEARLKNI